MRKISKKKIRSVKRLNKKRILFAVSARKLEDALELDLANDFDVVGTVLDKGGVESMVAKTNPDILIIREALSGAEPILKVIKSIRSKYSQVRIVFMSGRNSSSDKLLSNIVSMGIYDLILGESVSKKKIISILRKPMTFQDVNYLLNPDNLANGFDGVPQDVVTPEKEIVEVPVEKIIEVPVEKFVDRIVEVPVEKIVEKIVEVPVEVTREIEVPASSKFDSPMLQYRGNEGYRGKRKIVSFIGATGGVGTTQMALNTATTLAKTGANVLYVELNRQYSTVDFAFQIGDFEKGIDKALKTLSDKKSSYLDLRDNILKISDILENEDIPQQFKKNYSKFPISLDFLLYSQDYQTLLDKPVLPFDKLQEMITSLIFQSNYDYLILDHEHFGNLDDNTKQLLTISSEIFTVFNQDVAQINQINRTEEVLDKEFGYKKKNMHILNKFENGAMSEKEIEEWLDDSNEIIFPYISGGFISAFYYGLPYVLTQRSPYGMEIFDFIVEKI